MAERTRLKLKIPAGIADGGKIRLAGKGEPGIHGGPPGDLYIAIQLQPHPLLTREGDDLFLKLPITVPEATLGATVEIPTLEGAVRLKIPPGSQSGQRLRLREKGAPNPRGGRRGDLYAELSVRVPDPGDDDPAIRDAVSALEAFYSGDVRGDLRL